MVKKNSPNGSKSPNLAALDILAKIAKFVAKNVYIEAFIKKNFGQFWAKELLPKALKIAKMAKNCQIWSHCMNELFRKITGFRVTRCMKETVSSFL